MKALFAHSLKFLEDEDERLFLRGYNYDYWKRYLIHFDEIYVIGRKTQVSNEETQGYNRFFGDRLHFVEVPEIHLPIVGIKNLKNSNKIIEALVRSVDYVIARLPGTYSSKAIKYCKKHNKPYLVEMVGCPWDALWNHSLKGKIAAPLMTLSTKKLVGTAPYVVYVTNEFLQKRYPTEGKSTNCSNVNLPQLDDNILEKRIKKIHDMKEHHKLVIGTTAAVDIRYKGQQYVIEALGKLKKQGFTNFEYQLVGGGDQTYLLSVAEQHGVEEQVKLLGSFTHDKVFEWLDEIDIYVQPSRQEGLPRALIEAMSRGLPVLGARTGGIPELLDSKYIFSNTNYNIKEICLIIEKITKDVMSKQAKRNFTEASKYQSEVIGERRKVFFKKFISESIGNDRKVGKY